MLKKVKGIRYFPIFRDKLHAVLLHKRLLFHFFQDSEPFQGEIAEGHERLADMVAGKFFFLEQDDSMAFLCKEGRRGSSTGAPTDDNDVTGLFIAGNIHWW